MKKKKPIKKPVKKKEKVVKVKKEKEITTDKNIKFEHVFEDDFCIQIVKWDKSKFKNGPISTETSYKKLLPAWEKMMSKAAIKKFYQQNGKPEEDE